MQTVQSCPLSGNRVAVLITTTFLVLVLGFSAVESGEIHGIQTHLYTFLQPQIYSQTPDGYISSEELNLLAKSEHYRTNISRTLDQVPVLPPAVIPQCTSDNLIYHPAERACAMPCRREKCGHGMLFDWTTDRKYGACRCMDSCTTPCWAKPSILAGDKCYKVATRGPCEAGQVLIPVDRYSVKCGTDACPRSGPKNAVNFSTWSQKKLRGFLDEQPFLFTYNSECYLTETEAFCGTGKVARFLIPYKSPFCVPRDFEECHYAVEVVYAAGTTEVKVPCGPGLVEDRARNLCVPVVDFD